MKFEIPAHYNWDSYIFMISLYHLKIIEIKPTYHDIHTYLNMYKGKIWKSD